MMKADLNTERYLSKKLTKKQETLMIKKNWILLSCSGTIGNVVFTNDDFEGKIGTHDLIRIIPSDKKVKGGFLYAYLKSRFGYALLTQSGYGGVVKHIEPEQIRNLPVPIFSENKQQEIHNLIIESSNLRAEANKLLKEAQDLIEDAIEYKQENTQNKVSIKYIKQSHQLRFEAQYFNSEGTYVRNKIEEGEFKLLKEISEPIFRPGIFKRHYVKNGIDFLGGADISKYIPTSDKKLSISKTPYLNELLLKEDWILVTCGGTIGTSVLVNSYLAEKAASQHILRVRARNIKTGYLFAFLSSPLGTKVIQSYTYGSVIPQIEPHHLERLPIPILSDKIINEAHQKVMKYKENTSKAIIMEIEAINLIETEIDSWQN